MKNIPIIIIMHNWCQVFPTIYKYVRGIHRWPVNSLHKWPVTRKMFPFDVPCFSSWNRASMITTPIMTWQWAQWRLKSPALWLFTQPFIQAQVKDNIKALRHWPLWRESAEFPAQMASNAENVSIWWRHHDNFLNEILVHIYIICDKILNNGNN